MTGFRGKRIADTNTSGRLSYTGMCRLGLDSACHFLLKRNRIAHAITALVVRQDLQSTSAKYEGPHWSPPKEECLVHVLFLMVAPAL